MKNGTEGTEMKGRDGCCAALSVAGERGVVIMVGLRFGVARVPWAMRVLAPRGRVATRPCLYLPVVGGGSCHIVGKVAD